MLRNKPSTHGLLASVLAAFLVLLAARVLLASEEPSREAGDRSSLPSFRVTSLHQWMVDRMVSWSPPGISYVKEAKESPEDGRRRYEDIADDVISVAYDPSEKPIFHGPRGRAMTAALMTSIAFWESTYRKDVDSGIGPKARGDSGQSWCLMQVKMGRPQKDGRTKLRVVLGKEGLRFETDPAKAVGGWGGEDLVQDRKKCLRVAMRLARMSFGACGSMDVRDRLSMYTTGHCEDKEKASRTRVGWAQSWLWKHAPPLSDSNVMDLLESPSPSMPFERGATMYSPDIVLPLPT